MILNRILSQTNRTNRMSRVVIGSLVGATLLAAPQLHAQSSPPDASGYAVTQRKAVAVSAVEHAHLMTEMNDFMKAVHDIQGALSVKDFAAVTTLATAMGPKGGQHDAVGKAVHDKLPGEWFALARPTHQQFLAVAKEASKPGATVEAVLARLATTTQQCVACHATFKLTVAP